MNAAVSHAGMRARRAGAGAGAGTDAPRPVPRLARLDRLPVMACMAFLFVVGRLTFWIGYLLYPTARAFGMVMTALPTIAAYVWLLLHVLAR